MGSNLFNPTGCVAIRLAGIVLLAFGLCWGKQARAHTPPPVQLVIQGPIRPVLDWSATQCDRIDIPDAGLRAYRRGDGNIVVFANAQNNYPLIGTNFLNLHKVCHSAYRSAYAADPSVFADETWIAATWTDDGRNVMAIGHEEYHGEKHPGHCSGTTPRQCRYGALLYLMSHDGGYSFRKNPTPLAAVPAQQSAVQGKDVGFFQPSNIFERNGWKYVFVRTSGGGRQPPATCLMRAKNAGDPSSWDIYDGINFRPALFDPYRQKFSDRPICAQISGLNGLVWSVLTSRISGALIAVLTVIDPSTHSIQLATSTSNDVLHWSKPVYARGIKLQWGEWCPTPPYLIYPSLLDPQSSSRNFATVGRSADLFLTRIRIRNCRLTMDRDLVFMRAQLVPLRPH